MPALPNATEAGADGQPSQPRALKPAYLIHGDDHGAIGERRAALRALVEASSCGSGGVELLEGQDATPARVAEALASMTLPTGGALDRVIIVDGVERWRQDDVERHLASAMNAMPPATTVALFAREEARAKAPAAVHELVASAGGQVVAHAAVKPWELPKWVRERAARMGLALDSDASKALIAQVGERPQRLLRELEKLALERADERDEQDEQDEQRAVSAKDIEQRAAHSSESRAYALGDALVARDRRSATLTYVRLRGQGERLSGLTYLMASRLRDAVHIAQRLSAGESKAQVKRGLRMPARAADRLIAQAAEGDPQQLREALGVLADLELDSRGGPPLPTSRTALAALEEDTLAVCAIDEMTRAGERRRE